MRRLPFEVIGQSETKSAQSRKPRKMRREKIMPSLFVSESFHKHFRFVYIIKICLIVLPLMPQFCNRNLIKGYKKVMRVIITDCISRE